PVPASKRNTTGLVADQSRWSTSSASSADRSGVRSAGPVSLLAHGPGDHGTEDRVRGRSLMSLSVLANVSSLAPPPPPIPHLHGGAHDRRALRDPDVDEAQPDDVGPEVQVVAAEPDVGSVLLRVVGVRDDRHLLRDGAGAPGA